MKRIWFPTPGQVCLGPRSGSYLQSLFVGVTAPILNLPVMVWNAVVLSMLAGLWMIVSFTIMSVLGGLTGRVVGLEPDDSEASPG